MSRQPARGARMVWAVQALSGLILVPVLGLHWVAQHYVVEGGLRSFADVAAYLGHPVLFSIELAFLASIVIHALLGVRAIGVDLGLPRRKVSLLNLVLSGIGAITLIYGVWLLITVVSI